VEAMPPIPANVAKTGVIQQREAEKAANLHPYLWVMY